MTAILVIVVVVVGVVVIIIVSMWSSNISNCWRSETFRRWLWTRRQWGRLLLLIDDHVVVIVVVCGVEVIDVITCFWLVCQTFIVILIKINFIIIIINFIITIIIVLIKVLLCFVRFGARAHQCSVRSESANLVETIAECARSDPQDLSIHSCFLRIAECLWNQCLWNHRRTVPWMWSPNNCSSPFLFVICWCTPLDSREFIFFSYPTLSFTCLLLSSIMLSKQTPLTQTATETTERYHRRAGLLFTVKSISCYLSHDINVLQQLQSSWE